MLGLTLRKTWMLESAGSSLLELMAAGWRSFEFVDEPVRDDAGKVRRTALRDARIKAG